ncbi:Cell wall beta-1,6-glucan level regulator [Komagataella phaffii CBS 7435]|uniref:Protein BIG1 n=2 Tax=Komagataella phaffii TaxID=460519 RepID=C4R3L4_KOMPG|nr:Integral membrane protein of the endoplasmic reticulum, required for normal content of cell wall bet [Komagataella phaffii GS115]AOA63312.1 GQ67_03135T0 [Komagataella phaffii]CAH2450209.1 Cell wall beta-1,6-glucan level regulator [Komagataella phaffii CBS 7435]AOA69388.1 GQ68_03119T0 [Komagataella phaffii GS115]CAY70053.1 Integral membrane protein of the endoplasmic reticulum, required for normal content of cell wall bet [Komagataella phaffii GS115]CCA40059.1 Cell wall beta-1,6-glucan level
MKSSWKIGLFFIAFVVELVSCESSFPSFLFSHKLIPGIQDKLPHSPQEPFTLQQTNYMINQVLEKCQANVFILVNQPGVIVQDFQDFYSFQNLRSYMVQASTILTFPHTVVTEEDPHKGLDLDKIQTYIMRQCRAKLLTLKDDDPGSIESFIDSKTRVIRMDFTGIPSKAEEEYEGQREEILKKHDLTLLKVIRELPSPFITLLYTTDTAQEFAKIPDELVNVNEIPNDPQMIPLSMKNEILQKENVIFPDITLFDLTRLSEYERNNLGHYMNFDQKDRDAEPVLAVNDDKDKPIFNKPRSKKVDVRPEWLRFGEDDDSIPTLFNEEILRENALLVLSLSVSILGILLFIICKILASLVRLAFRSIHKQKTE